MKKIYMLSLVVGTLFVSCEDKKENRVVINQIEENITNHKTNQGCKDELKGCTEENDSAKFIFNVLDSNINNGSDENIGSVIEKIDKEEKKQEQIRENLMALIDEMDGNSTKVRTNIQNFVESVTEEEFKDENEKKLGTLKKRNKISFIREELENLVEFEEENPSPKKIRKKLENLLENVSESERGLVETRKTLTGLVEKIEKDKNNKSVKKFATALARDVANRKVSVVKENSRFYVILVQEGDNLSLLAKRYYNDTEKYKLIYEANKDKISSNYKIYPGTKLLIPKI